LPFSADLLLLKIDDLKLLVTFFSKDVIGMTKGNEKSPFFSKDVIGMTKENEKSPFFQRMSLV